MAFCLCLLATPARLPAQDFAIALLGVFNGKAVFMVDGQRLLLAEGETSSKGFTLVSLKAAGAVIVVDGQRKLVPMGATTKADGGTQGPQFAAPERQEVKILPDRRGMYFVRGRINRVAVEFLVDTGATTVALNARAARRLGIDYLAGKTTMVSTASGVAQAYLVNLSSVEVGAIRVPNVQAMVLDGDFPGEILLGNSFLHKVDLIRNEKVMTLRRKW